ncbi:MAG: uroporphyrinogen-III synthase [Ghiorsea sp.]
MKHLLGKSILLTRSTDQNKKTAALVKSFGAKPVLFPCSSIVPVVEHIQVAWEALQESTQSDVIFSSPNGVNIVAEHANDFQQTLETHRVIAVGQKTSEALKKHNVTAAWLPRKSSQQGIVEDYAQHGLPDKVMFFRAETGGSELVDYLQQNKVITQLIPTYQTILNREHSPNVLQQLMNTNIDAILLGSARTVEFYCQKVGNPMLANQPAIAVMSQQVRKAADKLGLSVQVIAKEPSFTSMLEGLNEYFAHQEKG